MNLANDKGRHGAGGAELGAAAEALIAAHHQAIGDLGKIIDGMAPQVIGVQTVVLDKNGSAAEQYRLPYQSLFVDSGSANRLTVANMPLQGAAPGAGPGVAFIRPGGNAVVNFRAYQWSVYGGNPGDLVTVTAFARPHGAHASSGPTSALTAAPTNVASSVTSVPLWAPQPSVNGRIIFNDSTAVLYVKFGATASTSSYTVQVAAAGYYEFPSPVYAGEVDGIWAAANGNARLTSW